MEAQQKLHENPSNPGNIAEELEASQKYKITHQDYVEFLSQKAKIKWIKDGDENTSLFHQSIRSRKLQNMIYSIYDENGIWGGPVNTEEHRVILNAPYTKAENKKAFFSIPGSKAPGTDGYRTYFYRDTWEVIGEDIVAAVLDSLQSGRILKEVNTTVITLIPKNSCPKNVTEYRPISCCNTLYKCITKVLCNRLRLVLHDLIMENQGGFVHGRNIIHNIMVIQDLTKHYGRKQTQPGCLLKIDLQKAYDTVNWKFLGEMLEALSFPSQFRQLVMECVTTPKFSLTIDGVMKGYFSSSRGLRQGDHISPLLFVLCMEYLSQTLTKMGELEQFHYHARWLQANVSKSAIYTCGMSQREQQRVVDVSGFTHQHLSFKYLGVPIYAKRISVNQCDVLVDKMIAKIKVFILPQQVLHIITQVCRSFLWSGQYFTLEAGNVAWEKICTPKSAGGLGFRDIFKWNIACLGRYVWAISTKQDSVWFKWVHSVYLKGGDWWEYTPNTSSSWYWRKLCQVKEQLKQSFTQAEIRNMRQYSVKHVYEVLMGEQERVYWDRVIWNRMNLPKHRFISWSAIQGKLQTTAKLVVMGISNSDTCLLCGSYKEDHSHHFFKCVPIQSSMSEIC
ncbi:uncharacterized protein LOC130591185 [Beta vulgaris subsp. vulgaris]|uniref:uncharacterized protein LOC130591185 n=1 Tax=Beta vulgaris subsp. vulgaris TaxID=3555 RepID=UPI0005400C5D|nr:uncharacterized protein LOC130591185 [Beta vulgaris subsp. vulgaris]